MCAPASEPAGAASSSGATCMIGSPTGTCSQHPSTPPTKRMDSAPYPMAVCSRSLQPGGRPWHQGLTLVHLPAQRKRFLWDKGCLGAVYEVLMVGLEGVFRALEDGLSVRNGSG